MTFDDGIVKIYVIQNVADEGDKPREALVLYKSFFFGHSDLGINRYYTALQAHQQIESVINVQGWERFNPAIHIAVMEDGSQFRIQMVQPMLDNDGLRITRLSLERINDEYYIEA